MTAKLEPQTIRIPQGAKTGPRQDPIYAWAETPAYCLNGLAVHKSLGRRPRWKWTVTHIGSGLQIECLGGRTKAEAEANMRAALDLPFDWTRGEDETLKAMRETPGIGAALRKIGERY